MKLRFYLSIGYPGANHEETVDAEGYGITPEMQGEELEFAIEAAVRDWALNYVEWSASIVDEGDDVE